MKKNLLVITMFFSSVAISQSLFYNGNGKESFGGAVGKGTLIISENTDSLIFTLQRGPGPLDSLLVFYVDDPNVSTGISTTSGIIFNGTSDKYSVAASGRFNSTKEAILHFPSNFRPDQAVVFDKDGGKIFFLAEQFGARFMQDQGTFTVTSNGTNTSPTYRSSASKTQIGVSSTQRLNFNFVGTYIGQTASRSNESIGDPFTSFLRTTSYNSYTIQSFFNYSTSKALPVNLSEFKVSLYDKKAQIKWVTEEEINIEEYEVQRSANGRDFKSVSTIKAKSAFYSTTYNAEDASPLKGYNYYRLLIKERSGHKFSHVVSVNNSDINDDLVVIQQGNSINVKVQRLNSGVYNLKIFNNNGQLIQSTSIQHAGINLDKLINLKSIPAKGIYRIILESQHLNLNRSIFLK